VVGGTSASGEIFIFARFHARPGSEAAVEAAIRDVLPPTREEPGCIGARAFHSIQDARLFYIHSCWRSEAAFDVHRKLPHTLRFLEVVGALIDHDFDVARTIRID
jgi:quinol monooxygenase YgiN